MSIPYLWKGHGISALSFQHQVVHHIKPLDAGNGDGDGDGDGDGGNLLNIFIMEMKVFFLRLENA